MRFILAFLVVMAGCVATLPGDNGLTADLAAETARMVVQMRAEIAPTPAPPSDGKCRNCDGRGYVGDGNGIRVTCQPCGGTGREPKSVVVKCPDGKCKP
jgi:hypothetical protein